MTSANTSSSKSETKLIQAAKELFWKHGISRVNVNDICELAGLSHMTFYRKFENKYEVALQIFKTIVEEGKSQYKDIMSSNQGFPQKMEAFIALKHEQAKDFSLELMTDLYKHPENHASILQYLATEGEIMKNQFICDLEIAQREGHIRQDLNLSFFLLLLNQLQQMGQDSHIVGIFSSVQEFTDQMTSFIMYGLLANSNSN